MPIIGIIFLSVFGFFLFLSLTFKFICSNERKDEIKFRLLFTTLIIFFINFIAMFISPIKTKKVIDDYELLVAKNVVIFIYNDDKVIKFTEHKDYKILSNSENKFKFYKEKNKNIFGFYVLAN